MFDHPILVDFEAALEYLSDYIWKEMKEEHNRENWLRNSAHSHALNAIRAIERFSNEPSNFEALAYGVVRALMALQIVKTPPPNHPTMLKPRCRNSEVLALGGRLKN
jgi:hypothetical protein